VLSDEDAALLSRASDWLWDITDPDKVGHGDYERTLLRVEVARSVAQLLTAIRNAAVIDPLILGTAPSVASFVLEGLEGKRS
jgi:hypothetical protein